MQPMRHSTSRIHGACRAQWLFAITALAAFVIVGCGGDPACTGASCDGTSGAGASGASGASGAGGGAGSGATPAECVPNGATDAVQGGCGVFVSSSLGDDANDGTKDSPLKTLAAAILQANAGGGRVYACAELFGEAVLVSAKTEIYGGLDCNRGWVYVGDTTKTSIVAPAGSIAATFGPSVNGARLEDLRFEAQAARVPGGSAIAIVVDQAEDVELSRCEVVAGDGAPGTPGDTPPGTGAPGAVGADGADGCLDTLAVPGGAGGQIDCGNGESSWGGQGGPGTTEGGSESDGQDGGWVPAPASAQNGGNGQSFGIACEAGMPGVPGENGDPGVGATGFGTLDTNGFLGTAGGDGISRGKPGLGGGGGGGGHGLTVCSPNAGPSGGGGGSGGCGGLPGKGGGPGGSSIGIVVFGETVATLASSTIVTGKGGDGGAGSNGQPGGDGGPGGAGSCSGGVGGPGGRGGAGGGGLGGHSIGVARSGGSVTFVDGSAVTYGAGGAGGPGGDGGSGNYGAPGDAGKECTGLDLQDTDNPFACFH